MTTSISATIQADAGARRRFEAKYLEDENGCWMWQAKSEDKDGYGQFRNKRVLHRAHRSRGCFIGVTSNRAWTSTTSVLVVPIDAVSTPTISSRQHAENMRRQRPCRGVAPPWQEGNANATTSHVTGTGHALGRRAARVLRLQRSTRASGYRWH